MAVIALGNNVFVKYSTGDGTVQITDGVLTVLAGQYIEVTLASGTDKAIGWNNIVSVEPVFE